MGFLLGLGYANVAGNPNDVESLLFTIQDFLPMNPLFQKPEQSITGIQELLGASLMGRGILHSYKTPQFPIIVLMMVRIGQHGASQQMITPYFQHLVSL